MKRNVIVGSVVVVVVAQLALFAIYRRPAPSTRPPHTVLTSSASTTALSLPSPLLLPSTWQTTWQTTTSRARLVHLWATWCAPCREELPALLQFAADHDVDVVAVSVDENDDVVSHFFAGAVPKSVVRLDRDEAVRVFGSEALQRLPVTIAVDDDGVVTGVDVGARRW